MRLDENGTTDNQSGAVSCKVCGSVTALRGVEAVAPPLVEPAKPLEECLGSFWRPGPELGKLQRMPPPHHAPHALLRRLGPSPLRGRFPLVGLLASVYDTVAARAIRLRDHAERLDERNGAE